MSEVAAMYASRSEAVCKYLRTGEITSQLICDAVVHQDRVEGGYSLANLREEARAYYEVHGEALLRIAEAVKEIYAAARAFEVARWLHTLQAYYKASPVRGHSGNAGDFKSLLWGSAGRVLLTLQDTKSQADGGKYGGAWVTLIFDENSPTPRGGIQGLCATREEALALICAATDRLPVMAPDANVGFL